MPISFGFAFSFLRSGFTTLALSAIAFSLTNACVIGTDITKAEFISFSCSSSHTSFTITNASLGFRSVAA
jgi:hypothetical protein